MRVLLLPGCVQGLAHAEKTEDRAGKLLKRKQAVAGLKTLY